MNYSKITLNNKTELESVDTLTMLLIAIRDSEKVNQKHLFKDLYNKGVDYVLTIQTVQDRLTATVEVYHGV